MIEDKAELLDMIKKDSGFKLEVLEAMLDDKKFQTVLAKEVLNIPAEYVGINVPGTLWECLNKFSNELSNK